MENQNCVTVYNLSAIAVLLHYTSAASENMRLSPLKRVHNETNINASMKRIGKFNSR